MLHSAFTEHAATTCEEEGPIAFVTTWFLRDSFEQTSEKSRTLRLDQYVELWQQDVFELWRDKIDLTIPLHLEFVQPEPPRHDTSWTIGHLIVHQRVGRPYTPVLVTLRFLTDHRTGVNYVAAVLETPTTGRPKFEIFATWLEPALNEDAAFVEMLKPLNETNLSHCVRATVLFSTYIHPLSYFTLAMSRLLLHNGTPSILTWLLKVLKQHPTWLHSLISQSSSLSTGMCMLVLRRQDLNDSCVSQRGLHGDRLRMNDEIRSVYFADDFHSWESHIRRTWQDLLDPDLEVQYSIVWDPPGSEYDVALIHIIVHQALQASDCANVVTIYDDHLNLRPYTTAAIVPAWVDQSAILAAVHREHECPPIHPGTLCTTWHGGWQFHDHAPYRGRHGYAYLLIIQSRSMTPWQEEEDDYMHPDAAASTNLLQLRAETRRQTTGQVAHTQWPAPVSICLEELIEPPKSILVDFSSVIHLAQSIREIGHLFQQVWPPDLDMSPPISEAIESLLPITTATKIGYHFYTDGSKLTNGKVGSAVIMFVESTDGWHFGGCLYHPVRHGTTATDGENGALVWALLWAITLSTQHWNTFGSYPIFFNFHFDAMNSGYLAAGYWRTTYAMTWRTVMRSLAQVLQTRHGLHALLWNYVPAHSGFVWNEAVDTLAKYAASVPLPEESPNEIWELWMQSSDHLTALQWLWYYELMQANDSRVPSLINGHMTCTLSADRTLASLATTTTPDQPQPEPSQAVQLRFTIATANVLTLRSGTVERPTIARQTLLMEQMDRAGCTIVGVQETRHHHLVAKSNDLYHIFGHPASPQGTDGIQLWISKRIPVDDMGNTICTDQIRIVASDVNFIIAKLRLPHWCCLVFTCRAPHSGRPRAEAVQFWSKINHIIQRKGKNWPLLFCGDTNAHLGNQPTDAVGTLWPSMENQAGQVFHEWLLQHDLFLPATFPQYHLGSEHASFFAPDGNHEVRIDYVALPRSQMYSAIDSKIADDIDLSVHRCDHRAVVCSFELAIDGSAFCSDKRRLYRQKAPDVQDLAYKLQQTEHLNALHYAVSAPPWDMDPHQSATTLAFNVNQAISHIAQPKGQWKRKWHLSETTWDLVAAKKSLYKQWRCMRKSWRFTILQACFPQLDQEVPHCTGLH